jgi:hypothetical protein
VQSCVWVSFFFFVASQPPRGGRLKQDKKSQCNSLITSRVNEIKKKEFGRSQSKSRVCGVSFVLLLREQQQAAKRASFKNDPSAGSPTDTLLRLLLPLDDKI